MYPVSSKYGKHQHDTATDAGLPVPTDALPGTPEKVAVLTERARLKQRLWHPDDART